MAIAFRLGGFGALQRLADGPAHDELAAENTHGLDQSLADHRLTALRHQAAKGRANRTGQARVEPHDAPRQHQPPGRGIDE